MNDHNLLKKMFNCGGTIVNKLIFSSGLYKLCQNECFTINEISH